MNLVRSDARRIPLAEKSVHVCVTSPPYWGLRDYGLATWEGGDAECGHFLPNDGFNKGNAVDSHAGRFPTCPKCGAVRHDAGIGLERTPEEYVANIVAVFREVWRVLRDDGTLWMNLGDCYASAWPCGTHRDNGRNLIGNTGTAGNRSVRPSRLPSGLKEKDLVGIPWRVAFALQADGWYLRSDIVWAKPNPMPESVTDRPTKSHEYLFLLAKQQRYYYDAEAVREDAAWERWGKQTIGKDYRGIKPVDMDTLEDRRAAGRNRRDVWFIATQPYKGAHFATYPEKLVEPCILAGSSPKACGVCGAPWERVTEKSRTFESGSGKSGHMPAGKNGRNLQGGGETLDVRRGPVVHSETVGWRPTCDHNDDTGKCVVLDPFCGSGTTGAVARRLGREFVGLDMSAEYLELAYKRIGAASMGMGI